MRRRLGKERYPDESDMKSSPAAYRVHMAFGNGARTYVATTRSGSQLAKRAHERMTRRKPHARLEIMLVLRNYRESNTQRIIR